MSKHVSNTHPSLFEPEDLPQGPNKRRQRLIRSKRTDLAEVQAQAADSGGRVYQALGLVLCTLPYRPVKGVFMREAVLMQTPNHKVTLQTHVAPTLEGVDAPHGRDRLLLVWLITRAKQSGSRVISFTRREFLEDFKGAFAPRDTDGFKSMAMRVLNMQITFRKEEFRANHNPRSHKRWTVSKDDIKPYTLFAHRRVDGGQGDASPSWRVSNPGDEAVYHTEFSEEFWNSEMAKVVPLSMEVVRQFADRPKALDLAWFLSWRSYGLMRAAEKTIAERRSAGEALTTSDEEIIREETQARIPWGKNGPALELGPQLPCQDSGLREMFGSRDSNPRRLKQTMEDVITELRNEWWPEARIGFDGSTLVIKAPVRGRMLVESNSAVRKTLGVGQAARKRQQEEAVAC